jgi:hypothetical protein
VKRLTGPEHYAEAARLLAPETVVLDGCTGDTITRQPNPDEVARALVHATLAQTAATIDAACTETSDPVRSWDWSQVTNP